ncbi:M48 family metallopeptidase [Acinetobacter sp. ANC 3781]|uniref:M48 family metallopeptidase n=1 Tax=Acinetobacter sp. ANC 3781 TaxID=2529835 RepID=UPI00103D4DDB|nr:SprT family zinc-dependent metalloprotease [Acinetobacter sp. ANC 3781]TCB79255.1 M48 family peptidase [Acinetobacter sp. ANC 3781]
MTLNELPEIKIVRHARAKCLRLRVDSTQIRLTAPVLCSKRKIQNFIDQAEEWLLKTWQQQTQNIQQETLPTELKLFNVDQPLQIVYQTQKQSFIFDEVKNQLLISDRQPQQYLKAFVITYAKQHLPLYLEEVSQESSLSFGKCTIRQPKTRWGSCSAKHDIMLNSGLVLFPEHVTRYVCVHELAHTRHFDHSPHFWAEVHKHDENFQQHRKILKTTPMPYWWL